MKLQWATDIPSAIPAFSRFQPPASSRTSLPDCQCVKVVLVKPVATLGPLADRFAQRMAAREYAGMQTAMYSAPASLG